MSTSVTVAGKAQRPLRAAERLDRLPPSAWLRRVMAVLFLSWLIESYDIGLTGSVLPSLTHQFALGTGMKSFTAIAANIGIVAGIVPAGWLADRYGRKPLLLAGTLIYAVLTGLTALAPDIWVILGLRLTSGLAMGAVFPLPYVYGSELCPADRRGRFTGIADAFLSIGYFLSPLLAIWLIPSTSNPTGWRIMFALGALPLLFVPVVWRVLPESPRWCEAHDRVAQGGAALDAIEARVAAELGHDLPPLPAVPPGGPAREAATSVRAALRYLLGRRHRRKTLLLWATFGGTFFLFYSVQTFMPTVVHDMGFTLTSSFAFTAVIVGASLPGKLLEAWVVERWGRKPVLIGFTLLAAAAGAVFGFLHGALPVLAVGCVLSFFGIGVDPAVKVYTAESFPTDVRAVGTASTEGVGRLLSGVIGPSLVPPLLAAAGVGSVYLIVAGVAVLAVVAVAASGRETRGRSLEQAAGEA